MKLFSMLSMNSVYLLTSTACIDAPHWMQAFLFVLPIDGKWWFIRLKRLAWPIRQSFYGISNTHNPIGYCIAPYDDMRKVIIKLKDVDLWPMGFGSYTGQQPSSG